MEKTKPYVIAINAVSGGGKTSLAKLLRDSLPATLFCFDDFDDTNVHPSDLYDWCMRGADPLEFDCPGMKDAVERAMNDSEIAYIVLDFPFGRDHPSFREVIDLSVFIDTPLDIAMARRILRDSLSESGSTKAEALSRLREELEHYVAKSRLPYLDTYRHKETSELILNGCGTLEEWRDAVLARVRSSRLVSSRIKRR